MKIERRTVSPFDRIQDEIAREHIENIQAIQDYNIMMGNLEDPNEEEEEEDE